ncbi:MAG: HD domain-containing protein [Firmicutes bacterium]|nr:HD domain-containing protein [Bacillota bacterium]
MSINRKLIIDRFIDYTSGYDIKDEKILLKIVHTEKVAQITDEISEALGLCENDRDIAWSIGMLHDIGRFEQVRIYGTFKDAESINHASFGADLLFKEGLIESFGGSSMTDEELSFIETAIRQHNKFRIEDGFSGRHLMFCNIIRDADKIDILRVNMESPMEVIYGVTTEELYNSEVSPAVLAAFNSGSCVLRSTRGTAVDNLVSHICFAFELVFPISRRIAADQGYLYQMLAFESNNPITRKTFAHMNGRMREYLK